MTDKERIIRAFGKEIVQGGCESNFQTGLPKGQNRNFRHGRKRIGILFCGSDINLTRAFEGLRRLQSEGYHLHGVMTQSASAIGLEDRIVSALSIQSLSKGKEEVDIQKFMDAIDGLVVPNITQNTLSKVAVGIQDNLGALLIWQALITNKPVFISTDSVFSGWFDINKNRAMKMVMQNHVATLKQFGAKEDNHYNYNFSWETEKKSEPINSFANQERSHLSVKSMESFERQSTKKLITESDIKAMEAKRELKLVPGQIVTPLAKDEAASKGIQIIYQRHMR